jgi:hypothetical protein
MSPDQFFKKRQDLSESFRCITRAFGLRKMIREMLWFTQGKKREIGTLISLSLSLKSGTFVGPFD